MNQFDLLKKIKIGDKVTASRMMELTDIRLKHVAARQLKQLAKFGFLSRGSLISGKELIYTRQEGKQWTYGI